MLSSYRVECPHEGCDWSGSLVPSLLKGGADAELAAIQRAWLHCPACRRDWEVRVSGDQVTTVVAKRGPSGRKASIPMAGVPSTQACPKCKAITSTVGMKTLQVEMRPILTAEVFAFPEALAEVNCVKCTACGQWICLDYRIELDDNPEVDLNPE